MSLNGALEWKTYNKNDNVSTATRFEIPPDKVPPPPQPSPFDDYLDNIETMRKASSVPRLLSQGPTLSGKAKARDEIFMRRAKLASELSKMGLPPMVDGLKQGRTVSLGEAETSNPILKTSKVNKKSISKNSGGKNLLPSNQAPSNDPPLEGEPAKVAPMRLLVLGGGESLTAEGILATKPYYPKRAPTVVPKNEEIGGDLGLVKRFQKDANEVAGRREAGAMKKAAGSKQGPLVKGGREERIRKLAACLAAAHDRGIINLGVEVEREEPGDGVGDPRGTNPKPVDSVYVSGPVKADGTGKKKKKKVLTPPASGRIEERSGGASKVIVYPNRHVPPSPPPITPLPVAPPPPATPPAPVALPLEPTLSPKAATCLNPSPKHEPPSSPSPSPPPSSPPPGPQHELFIDVSDAGDDDDDGDKASDTSSWGVTKDEVDPLGFPLSPSASPLSTAAPSKAKVQGGKKSDAESPHPKDPKAVAKSSTSPPTATPPRSAQDPFYESDGSWGIESDEDGGARSIASKPSKPDPLTNLTNLFSTNNRGTGKPEDLLDMLDITMDRYRPPEDSMIPDVSFTRPPKAILEPLPWYDKAGKPSAALKFRDRDLGEAKRWRPRGQREKKEWAEWRAKSVQPLDEYERVDKESHVDPAPEGEGGENDEDIPDENAAQFRLFQRERRMKAAEDQKAIDKAELKKHKEEMRGREDVSSEEVDEEEERREREERRDWRTKNREGLNWKPQLPLTLGYDSSEEEEARVLNHVNPEDSDKGSTCGSSTESETVVRRRRHDSEWRDFQKKHLSKPREKLLQMSLERERWRSELTSSITTRPIEMTRGDGAGIEKEGPLDTMRAEEQVIALGRYDASKYNEFARQVDLEAERRRLEGGWSSDEEREKEAFRLSKV